jgi:hypothetical protein
MARKRKTIFISYSHVDHRWLKFLRTAMAPLTNTHRLDLWDDKRIAVGANWRREIESALTASNVAVLLVTQNFFDSKFIMTRELPILFGRRKQDGLLVVWIPVSSTNYKLTPLRDIQSAHDPSRPLDMLSTARRNKAFVDIVNTISSHAAVAATGDMLQITDEITPTILPVSGKHRASRRPGIVARRAEGGVEFRNRRGVTIDKIDPPRLGRLSEAQRDLIFAYHSSMANAYERWEKLYPRRASLTKGEQSSLRRARRQMCEDLGKLIVFYDRIKKYVPDHYRTVRNECEKLHRSRQ